MHVRTDQSNASLQGKYKEEDDLTPPTSTASLSPPLSDTSISSSELSVESCPLGISDVNEAPSFNTLCACVEKDSIQCSSNTVTAISVDPLAALALAASKARGIPSLSLLDTSQESPLGSGANETQSSTRPILELEHAIVPATTPMLPLIPGMLDITTTPAPVSKSTKGNGKAKMCPGPTKNGHNLCAHHWCKQVQSGGSTEEFQQYYNGLTAEQRKAYDDEATALTASNNWDAKNICNGMLH